jgi:hypothetical protein
MHRDLDQLFGVLSDLLAHAPVETISPRAAESAVFSQATAVKRANDRIIPAWAHSAEPQRTGTI